MRMHPLFLSVLRSCWAHLVTAVRSRVKLMFETLSPPWTLLVGFGLLSTLNIGLALSNPEMPVEYVLPLLTAVLSWNCLNDFRQKRERFGGKGFFDVLRRQKAHDAYIQEVRDQVRRRQKTSPRQDASDRARVIRETLAAIRALDGEPRAGKVAKKAETTREPVRLIQIIADNGADEPKSARIAQQGLKRLNV